MCIGSGVGKFYTFDNVLSVGLATGFVAGGVNVGSTITTGNITVFSLCIDQNFCQADLFLTENGAFPAENGAFPAGNGAFPTENGAFPIENGAFPTGNDAFPTGNDAFPTGNGVFPPGLWASRPHWFISATRRNRQSGRLRSFLAEVFRSSRKINNKGDIYD